jgi:hypothetical protein
LKDTPVPRGCGQHPCPPREGLGIVAVPWLYHVSSALSIPPQQSQDILLHRCGNCLQINHKKCNFLLCCRLLSSPLEYFFSLSMLWALYLIGPISLAASCGVGTHRLQRPSIRAGTNTRHPMLYASVDGSRKACRRRPHLYDGFLQGPEIARAASTSTKIERGLSTAIPLMPL